MSPEDLSIDDLLSTTLEASVILDLDGVVVAASEAYLRLTAKTRDELVGHRLLDAFDRGPEAPQPVDSPLAQSLRRVADRGMAESMATFRWPILRRTETGDVWKSAWWDAVNTPIVRNGEMIGILHVVRDVTASVLQDQGARTRERMIARMTGLASSQFDPKSDRVDASPALLNLFGFPESTGLMTSAEFFDRVHPDDMANAAAAMENMLADPEAPFFEVEYRVQLPGGETRWVATSGEFISRDEDDPIMISLSRDVTDARLREQELIETLAERDRLLTQKDTLLGEVNHRIKNSLQIVNSLLKLEVRSAEGSELRKRLATTLSRVQAMASVHDLIFRADQMATVALGEHLPKLCRAIDELAPDGASVACNCAPVVLTTDRAISLALLVNELITPPLTEGRSRHVDVELSEVDDTLRLRVHYDGSGSRGSNSVSRRIVDSIARQLDASVEFEERDGRECVIADMQGVMSAG
ncbi:sensor histidine kinase [Jannaschia ovalis]|uniref:histidine kinase n=1 Tax=Jannaschia ovalis TaxID=3038773 RepID=A0ABY8LEF3_9RHOB|nr:histidine kinase dimerization/phosphoacceptor domain -containing protein [Jannaschia sp. GRR-S6-38]WGH78538.1 histidine kinase dimerization/phosphoacceptor domain -containing protein [Jannaschia sp. GRR-S6-38]